jgi:hypothetical protein
MRVFKKDGKWFSMDNRRLWVFRKLEAEGHIKDVTVRHTSRDKLPDDKFTTQNGGADVSIRDTTAFSTSKCARRVSGITSIMYPQTETSQQNELIYPLLNNIRNNPYQNHHY